MPAEMCPRCGEGKLIFGTFDTYCSKCDYREPHVHDIRPEERGDGIFGLRNPGPCTQFACTCTEWDTPEEHERRRRCLTSSPLYGGK